MNGALRMDDHADLVGRHVEQAARFDYLETLVHQRGRVDRNALAHLPSGMVESLLDGDAGEVAPRSVQEGPARRGKPDAMDFVAAPAPQALMDRVVLAVDGQKR